MVGLGFGILRILVTMKVVMSETSAVNGKNDMVLLVMGNCHGNE